MKTFAEIRDLAVARKGAAGYQAELPAVPELSLAEQPDHRILAAFSEGIFQTGLSWQMILNKWPAFEEAFHGFDIGRNALMSDEELDAHLKNAAIVRHAQKIISVRDNAVMLSDMARAHGSAAAFMGNWPLHDQVGLFAYIKKHGSRLGGSTGPYALRQLGWDNFYLSRSVVAGLHMAGVIDGPATSKRAQSAVQEAFNQWQAESGERYAVISKTLALAVPD